MHAFQIAVRSALISSLAWTACFGHASGQIELSDVGPAVGLIGYHHASAETVPGAQEWMTGGMAVGDFNRDGWPDIFYVSGSAGPDLLFINDGDGTFSERGDE